MKLSEQFLKAELFLPKDNGQVFFSNNRAMTLNEICFEMLVARAKFEGWLFE
jgi:hypothetical protein